MELTIREDRFVFRCEKSERATPKAAGFRFDWDKFVWWSDNALAAGRLLEWADDKDRPTGTVYGYVPADRISLVCVKHGGIVSGELPAGIPAIEADDASR